MRILITGGLGFIGSYFAEKLSNSAEQIIILDNKTGFSLSGEDILLTKPNIKIHNVDIVSSDIDEYFMNIDIVYHFAANSKISEGVNNPNIDFDITVRGTQKVLNAMKKSSVNQIVFSSGSGVYGDQKETILSEDFGPLLPVSYYGASKLAAEAMISSFCGMSGFKAFIFRFANVVGLRQTHGVAYDFVNKLKIQPKTLEVLGNGMQSKSYIDVEDIFNGIELAIKKQVTNIDVYNISTQDYIDVRYIAKEVIKEMNLSDVKINYGEDSFGWVGDVPIVRFSSDKIRKMGWSNKYSSQEAIQRAIKFILSDDNS